MEGEGREERDAPDDSLIRTFSRSKNKTIRFLFLSPSPHQGRKVSEEGNPFKLLIAGKKRDTRSGFMVCSRIW